MKITPDHIGYKLNGKQVAELFTKAGLLPKGYKIDNCDVGEYVWVDCYREKE